MRTEDQIKTDFKQLLKEITAIVATMGDTGAPQVALYAVLDAKPELKARWDALNREARNLEADTKKLHSPKDTE